VVHLDDDLVMFVLIKDEAWESRGFHEISCNIAAVTAGYLVVYNITDKMTEVCGRLGSTAFLCQAATCDHESLNNTGVTRALGLFLVRDPQKLL
jgi:hypothetical protein